MPNKHEVNVKTEEEMITQLKLLLDNGYNVAICKHDNFIGSVSYGLIYEKKREEL